MKKLFMSGILFLSTLILTGCMTLQADPSLLNKTEPNAQPLVKQDYTVEVDMNDRLARQATAVGIDKLVYGSLKTALNNANIFTPNGKGYYKIHAHILQANQAAWSMRRFPGTMEIEYTVTDQNSNQIFTKKIFNKGESDKFFFSGSQRHTRSRIVTASDNVNQFVEAFNEMMKKRSKK
ncbi:MULTISPECIES: hypothetical protein [unclassified Avibacterium]|uniref:hypothetical protein n=1 Tax=unclassified Avibacterium TaxID=2685287 RepID=UPI002026E367|nr:MULTISPECIES: hypothetical protein [unclassified Avibacterium]MCW9698923.1 hypothetical protein [Avibacterium sp. 20-129]URL06863.1 hypothetical protein L4F92_01740 [Avibacterium sp. 21-595]